MPRLPPPDRRTLIHQIPIRIMLHHKPRRVPPIIEQLRTQNMSSDPPHGGVLFRHQPLVAQLLRVEVVHLETAVVDVGRGVCGHEEGVVVGVLLAYVDVHEGCDVFAGLALAGDEEEVGGCEVEGAGVEVEHVFEALDT